MLTKPRINPENCEEVKAGISSQVFVGFEQTFTVQGLIMGKEEVRECTCVKAHLQDLFPSLFNCSGLLEGVYIYCARWVSLPAAQLLGRHGQDRRCWFWGLQQLDRVCFYTST